MSMNGTKRKFDVEELAVAELYADALRRLAPDDEEEGLLAELDGIAEMLDRNPEVEEAFRSPLVDAGRRRETLEKTLRGRVSDLLVDTLQVMNRKGRLGLVRALAEAFRREFERARGIVEVEVTTAVPLSDEMRRRTAEAAGRMVGATARLAETVEPSLLGGIVIRVGDRKIDSAVSTEISKIGNRLLERSSRELLSGKTYVIEGS